jgi:hypothetical protein
MQDKRRTQQLQGLGNLLESTGIPKTVERAAYADSPRGLLDALTNVNRANVPLLKPETAEAAMTLAPFAAPVNRALMQATKGLPVGASVKNVGKDLSAIQIGDRTIPVTINRIDKKSGGELVNVNPSAFDEAFSKTSWQYVGEKGKEGISGRYEKFENFLKDAKSIEASNVSVNKDGGIVFGDGRHRYAVLRDMGLDELPIVMDKESIKNAQKFGYLADTKASLPVEEGLLATQSKQPMQGLLGQEVTDYRGSHTAPNAKTYGATLDSLQNIMPADVYSSKGMNLYGIGDKQIDSEWFRAAYLAKGNPDKLVEVYRAVPKGVKDINSSDWVTTSKTYAKNHGENTLDGDYEIITKKVKASTLSSEGYPYEFGYNE